MKKLKEIYFKYREVINYVFFGGCTTLISWLSYALFVGVFGAGAVLGNALSWVCAVIFAFVTNKLWVFFSPSWEIKTVLAEAGEFFGSRILTGILEMVGLPLLMALGLEQTLFGVEGFVAKIIDSVIVMILNYILSKFLVFRKKDKK